MDGPEFILVCFWHLSHKNSFIRSNPIRAQSGNPVFNSNESKRYFYWEKYMTFYTTAKHIKTKKNTTQRSKIAIGSYILYYLETNQFNQILNIWITFYILQEYKFNQKIFKEFPSGLVMSVSLELRNADHKNLLAGRWEALTFEENLFSIELYCTNVDCVSIGIQNGHKLTLNQPASMRFDTNSTSLNMFLAEQPINQNNSFHFNMCFDHLC